MQYIDVQKSIDQAKFTPLHFKVLLWCFVIILIDGYDVAIAGVAIPSIMQDMNVSAATAGFMASSALFGMMFGSILFGSLSEKIGRKWSLSICVFLFSFFTAIAGLSHDPLTFCILRFIAGIGIGGVQPNITAQMTEYSPKRIRSFMTTVMFSGYAVGGILAAVIGKYFILHFGWQIVFYAAAAPIILIPFILKYMPESFAFLLKKERDQEIKATLNRLDETLHLQANQSYRFRMEAELKNPSVPIMQLFQNGKLVSSLMFWIAFFTGLFMIYALSTWLTKLMAMSGYSLGSALSFVIALNTGAVLGCVVGGWLADKFHIKWVLVSMYGLGSIFLYLMTYNLSINLLYLLIIAVGACTTGAQIVAYAYCGQFYPADIRATGVGMATGIGRLGAILAPLIIGFIVMLNLPLTQNFLIIASAGLIGAIALAFINHEKAAV